MNTSEKTARRVPRKHMVGYGIGMYTSVSTLALVSLYLPYFYTDVFLLPPAVMAILFLACRVVLAVLMPFHNLPDSRFQEILEELKIRKRSESAVV